MMQQAVQAPDSSTVVFPLVEAPIPLAPLAINLALVLRAHFERFSSTMTNRSQFAGVFPFVLLTTLLIITIVKSSLALSLGLVGALSIVRFRTPIKEPEELAYIFLAIAMGLGLGANQTVPTVLAGLFILVVMAALKLRKRRSIGQNLYVSVDWTGEALAPRDGLDFLNTTIKAHSVRSDLRRFDVRNGSVEATYLIDVDGADQLSRLVEALRSKPDVGVTFIDQSQLSPP